jgi:signal transduction histidine kinase/ligand-binding sensor domain-containing protein
MGLVVMQGRGEVQRAVGRGASFLARFILLWLISGIHPARASGEYEQFHRSSWSLHENAPADIWTMAQARNGYLLLGTGSGLYRFDGITFQRFASPQGQLLAPDNITAMLQLPDGDIWLGYFSGGAGLIHDGQLIRFSTRQGFPDAMVYNFSRASDGTLWAATANGLVRFAHDQWSVVGANWNYPAEQAAWTLIDRDDNLWVTTSKRLLVLRKGSHQFLDTGIAVGIDSVLAQSPSGLLWLSDGLHGTRALPGLSAEHPQLDKLAALPLTEFARAKRLMFDRDGHLWITDASLGGVVEVSDPQTLETGRPLCPEDLNLVARHTDGLTADVAVPLLQDREGSVWVGTNLGLNSFRINKVVVPPEIRISPLSHFAITADPDGIVWIVNQGTLFRVEHRKFVALMQSLPDFDHIQAGVDGGLYGVPFSRKGSEIDQVTHGHLTTLPPIVSSTRGVIRAMAADPAGGLWVSYRNSQLEYFKAGRWFQVPVDSSLAGSDALCIDAQADGRVWFGYSADRLALLEGSSMRVFTAADGLHVGSVATINASASDVLIGGESGLARFKDGRIQSIPSQNSGVLSGVSGIVRSANGDVWINGSKGIVRIRATDLDEVFQHPSTPLEYALFDYEDGLPGIALQESMGPTAVADSDGRLWFSTNQGIASIDPRKLEMNKVPPPVDIQSLKAKEQIWLPRSSLHPPELHLPEDVRSVQIEYTALSLSIPSRVTFRYRLSGVDAQWQGAGDRREAFYTNLEPGHYQFRVIAANPDGLWNNEGATLDFTIRPTFYQSAVFRVFCVGLFVLVLSMLYVLRLRQLSSRLHERLNERHRERERIARELHDTLLQSVQGLMLRFQVAAEQLEADSAARRMLEKALDRSDEVLVEARNRVRDLRALTQGFSSLSRALALAGEELAQEESPEFRVITEGIERDLSPTVRDEAYRIGREALTNALTHSRASLIEVEINYDSDYLQLRIRDDGVGMDQDLLDAGSKPGHWGLAGMHERALRMNATLDIWGGDGLGTEVALKIPAAMAYCDTRSRYMNWLLRLIRGGRYG